MKVPFLDLVAPHREHEEELIQLFRSVIRSGHFVGGSEVESFESEFAAFCNTKECVAVNSGTDALRLALMAAGIGAGDVVLTAPNTFIATCEAISQTGASFEFVDVDESTGAISPAALSQYLDDRSRPRAKAVIPVHLYGQMADMDPILELAEKHGLIVIEDACQAHGASYYSRKRKAWFRAGSMGTAAGFSFYPGKNLGACGEGGAVTTNDPALAASVRMLRDHGQAKKYYHDREGWNARLDAVQCGILRIKLRSLEEWNDARRRAAARYAALLSDAPELQIPCEPEWSRGVYHLYVVRTPRRDELQSHLTEKEIGVALHYPIPLHMQRCYAQRGWRPDDFPVATRLASSILSLPMFPQLASAQQAYVAGEIRAFLSRSAAHAEQSPAASS